ncbi:hypothetical protein AKJ51_02950 [candidate division MSBL1 archaeon SCGC-AAA382A20]|uniref:Radical SAM core domain-containing protein n=1 Tax=candidate division MSBL1 archaeon SCGC-AAA382A20 TaxID=1698280 RepID=A0A133VJZ0_9EURY|nr:hypothetical protein AKJ51_02950 [candidate division MSBL1 archaeon SCGC-AAA382A20]
MLRGFRGVEKGECELCGEASEKISNFLPLCLDCIREEPDRALEIASRVHYEARKKIGLPTEIPKSTEGVECLYCANNCQIPEGGRGYCNLSRNEKGKLTRNFGISEKAIGSWYKDSHPTNCVASWCCAGGSGSGYPEYAKTPEGDKGYKNAAVFLGTCCYHCLYCQNTSWHEMASERRPVLERDELVEKVISDQSITCLCWFGGSPEPQAPFVHGVSQDIREKAKEDGRILRICLEACGNFSWKWLERIAKISLESGGGVKFDLKTWSEDLNRVLSGVSNKPTYDNFERLEEFHSEREEPPFLRGSTLLVPGYIDLEEIKKIARFISRIDPSIPYSLLGYGPAYRLDDLPLTEKEFAFKAKKIAEGEGLKKVRVGNKKLLS